MPTDPMRPMPPPPLEGGDAEASARAEDTDPLAEPGAQRDEQGSLQRKTAPPVPPATGGLPFRAARRDTPTMVSPHRSSRRVQTVNMASPAMAPALPFKRARVPTPPAGPVSTPVLPFKAAQGPTAAARAPDMNALLALPFRAPRPSRLTLEQFASLAAEIAVWPGAVPQLRARYGLDEASHRDEHASWQLRFSNDRDLFARYAAVFQHYRDWLERRAGQ